ncbi:hypothetical protein BN59_01718 [Legionella massiliensis]|uniref:Endo-1,4-beta-xylanase-like protein n=1 Tax=Legionella massiliensis TaxID=1034943 RepID=A0A078KSP5_9GAMM|nr:DUF3298 and DUF4163 domain-containing protein [Legionella massiliensis]CDZ77435.1 hypothetical protein BN59_01718 [Legionella massiliensis]CEE13173.1 Peptidoglycan-N-acetylmuramic acid deacetylase PdaC [Legionella massiliensis]
MLRSILALIFLCCSLGQAWASKPATVVIKKETTELDLQIKYPQGFANKNIDETVQNFIQSMQKNNRPKAEKLSADVPGISSLRIDYKIKFQNPKALSLLFSLSAYTRGAAHPANSVQSLNFLNNQVVTLDQLFKPESNYLTELAKLSSAAIKAKQISDKDWIATGTKPTQENYKNWFFSKNGLAIVFDTYQVAAYVYGPQTVLIPKAKLSAWLRPEVSQTLWGN